MIEKVPMVFSTDHYRYLARSICDSDNLEMGDMEARSFPDGERYRRLLSDVEGREVAVVAGTIGDADTLELFDLACAIVHYGARRLSLVVPYFGYSTMDRAIKPGEVVTAKSRARLLSAIPECPWGNQLLLLDLHSEGLPYYFEGAMRPVHVYAKPVIREAAVRLAGDDFVLACTDAGRAKWVQSLANDMGVSASFVFKRRLDGRRTEVTAVSAQVDGSNVVIYDDMIRTGGSLINAAQAYKDAGANKISAIATHGVLPGDALDVIEQSGLFERIVCTDTHPRAMELQSDFLEIVSIAPLLASHLEDL